MISFKLFVKKKTIYLMKQHCLAKEGMTGKAAIALALAVLRKPQRLGRQLQLCKASGLPKNDGMYLMKQHCLAEEGIPNEAALAS